jgi:hypothetical protein
MTASVRIRSSASWGGRVASAVVVRSVAAKLEVREGFNGHGDGTPLQTSERSFTRQSEPASRRLEAHVRAEILSRQTQRTRVYVTVANIGNLEHENRQRNLCAQK